jgi:hypothetical protein
MNSWPTGKITLFDLIFINITCYLFLWLMYDGARSILKSEETKEELLAYLGKHRRLIWLHPLWAIGRLTSSWRFPAEGVLKLALAVGIGLCVVKRYSLF